MPIRNNNLSFTGAALPGKYELSNMCKSIRLVNKTIYLCIKNASITALISFRDFLITLYGKGCEVGDTHMENLQDIFSQVSSQFCIAAYFSLSGIVIFITYIFHRKDEVTCLLKKQACEWSVVSLTGTKICCILVKVGLGEHLMRST